MKLVLMVIALSLASCDAILIFNPKPVPIPRPIVVRDTCAMQKIEAYQCVIGLSNDFKGPLVIKDFEVQRSPAGRKEKSE